MASERRCAAALLGPPLGSPRGMLSSRTPSGAWRAALPPRFGAAQHHRAAPPQLPRGSCLGQEGGGLEERRAALLASQQHVRRSMREAVVACRAEEGERRGVGKPLRAAGSHLDGSLLS